MARCTTGSASRTARWWRGPGRATRLPVSLPADVTAQAMLDAMGSDKKVSGGKVRYIVLSQLGEAMVAENVTDGDIARVIDA